jgi:hypothetical protein
VQQAHASDDSVVKIKYRIHSETVTVFSQWFLKSRHRVIFSNLVVSYSYSANFYWFF